MFDSYSTRIDPTGSRKPLGCLPDSNPPFGKSEDKTNIVFGDYPIPHLVPTSWNRISSTAVRYRVGPIGSKGNPHLQLINHPR